MLFAPSIEDLRQATCVNDYAHLESDSKNIHLFSDEEFPIATRLISRQFSVDADRKRRNDVALVPSLKEQHLALGRRPSLGFPDVQSKPVDREITMRLDYEFFALRSGSFKYNVP